MDTGSIILFDGVCNLCNGAVQFVIRHDRKNRFLFGALQSEAAHKILEPFGVDPDGVNSFILVEQGRLYYRSTGALRVLKGLGGWLKWGYGLIIIPAFIRDAVYNLVANKRYRWFGKKDQCMVPTPELQKKFLPTY